MTTLVRTAALTATAAGLLATMAPTGASAAGASRNEPGVRLTATLSGANEVGGAAIAYPGVIAPRAQGVGDPDGAGTATFTVRPSTGQICYAITVTGTATPTRAHIHNQVAGQNGPIDVELYEAKAGTGGLSGCTTTDVGTARSIVAHPEQYYANLHDAVYPAGSVRGQLQHSRH